MCSSRSDVDPEDCDRGTLQKSAERDDGIGHALRLARRGSGWQDGYTAKKKRDAGDVEGL